MTYTLSSDYLVIETQYMGEFAARVMSALYSADMTDVDSYISTILGSAYDVREESEETLLPSLTDYVALMSAVQAVLGDAVSREELREWTSLLVVTSYHYLGGIIHTGSDHYISRHWLSGAYLDYKKYQPSPKWDDVVRVALRAIPYFKKHFKAIDDCWYGRNPSVKGFSILDCDLDLAYLMMEVHDEARR